MQDATSRYFAAATLSCAFLMPEGALAAGPNPCPDVCPANLDGDEAVGMNDILVLLRSWGDCPPEEECPADVNGDRVVDAADVFVLLADWGPCARNDLFAGGLLDPDRELRGRIVEVADFDHDGAPDVVLLDSRRVTIAGNDGEGRLSVMATLMEHERPTEVVTGDFDGDGNADTVVAERNTINVFLGDGAGAFDPQPPILTVLEPEALTAVDIDGDGLPDLVASSENEALVGLRNIGEGMFGEPAFIDVGLTVYPIAADDFNGDDRADLVAVTAERGLVLLLNDGAGSFGATPQIPVEGNLDEVSLLDFDDDGDTDLAISSTGVTVRLLRNDGFGSFSESSAFSIDADSLKELAAGDFNEDGHADLVAFSELHVVVFSGDGDGGFGPGTTGVMGYQSTAAVVDLNSDGHLDLLIEGGLLSVRLGDGDGNFGVGWAATPSEPLEVLLRDMTGNGHLDLVALTRGGAISLRPGDGSGSFGPGGDFAVSPDSMNMAIADIDGDGDLDVAITDRTIDTVWLVRNDGTGTLETPDGGLKTDSPRALALADINGDERPDLILAIRDGVEIRHNLGGIFGSPSVVPGVAERPRAILVHDLDGDSDPDLALGTGDVIVLRNDGTGVFSDPRRTFGYGGYFSTGDLDADGDFDLVTTTRHSLWLLQNDGDGNFPSAVRLDESSRELGPPVVHDIDGDGDSDIVLASIRVLINDATGTFASPLMFPAQITALPSIQVGDLDGDGDGDIVTTICSVFGDNCAEGGICVLFNRTLPCPDGD